MNYLKHNMDLVMKDEYGLSSFDFECSEYIKLYRALTWVQAILSVHRKHLHLDDTLTPQCGTACK